MTLTKNIYTWGYQLDHDEWYEEDRSDETIELIVSSHMNMLFPIYRPNTLAKTWPVVIDEELDRIFLELKEKWETETSFLSSTTDIIHNVNYQYIIGLGPNVIPLLLKDMEETHNFWFWALTAISRENPVPEEDVGNTEKMVDRWLEWGHRKGYL